MSAANLALCGALIELENRGFVRHLQEVADECIGISCTSSWGEVARELSLLVGGQLIPTSDGVTWQNGRQTAWVMNAERVADLRRARRIARRLIERERPDLALKIGWSVGSCARQLLAFVGPPQRPESSAKLAFEGSGFAYFDCAPGTYEAAQMWDVSACYYSLMKKLPSLRLSYTPTKLLWHSMEDDERARWARVLEVCEREKLLRNCLLGCALGKVERGTFYCRGEKGSSPAQKGPFSGAAALVVRTSYECTQIAAQQTRSVYSNSDCVTSIDGSRPQIWDDCGLVTRLEASGPAQICAHGIYKVGNKPNFWFDRGSRFTLPAPALPAPPRSFRREWIGAQIG